MAHQIPEYYHTLSELLSNILDNAGYSRADRYRKVKIAAETDVFRNIDHSLRRSGTKMYMLGSRGEGSTGPGLDSDHDFLHETLMIKIIMNLSDYQPDRNNYLMVKDDVTHPGYVKLQFVAITSDQTPAPIYHLKSTGELVILDTFNRSVLSNGFLQKLSPVSGPALQRPSKIKELSVDEVVALRCSQWPREGYEWFHRRRLHGWPTPKQIANAWGYGCFVTAVGHPQSQEKHVECRLSFSIAERSLVRSFEDTAMKVYILLKMIKKTFINPVVGDSFSSYHCKVCLLWTREGTQRDLWKNENILYCLVLCIRQLYEWATRGFCPDYFIVANNIYDRELTGRKQVDLIHILGDLLSTDCIFLLDIECGYLGQQLANEMSGFDLNHTIRIPLITREITCEYIHSSTNTIHVKYIPQYYPTLVDFLAKLMYASRHSPNIMQFPLKYVMMVLWSQLGFHIVSVCRQNTRVLSREQIDYLVYLASGCLSLGINYDATSVRLKLCGLGMELGYYDLTEVCLHHIKDNLMKYVFACTFGSFGVLNYEMEKAISTEEFIQTHISFSVVYMLSEIPITPAPLRMEMFRSIGAPSKLRIERKHFWYDWGVVDSLICLYFFQYLNFRRQGKERHKRVAVDSMINVIRTKTDIQHRDTAFNILGYSFIQENQLTSAFSCFMQSLEIRQYHNAAKFYMGILFKRIHAIHRRKY